MKSKSKKTVRTVIGRSDATRRSDACSKNPRVIDDGGEQPSQRSGTRQGQVDSLGESSLTPERIRRVNKKIMAQRRAKRRRIGELKTISEALSHEIDQYKQALDRSRLHLDTLQKLPAVAWTIAPDGRCDFVNQFYLDATGLSADYCTAPLETWRKTPSDLPPLLSCLRLDHKERVSHIFWEGIRSGEGWTFEAPFLHAGGSYHWHLERAVPMRDASGKVIRFVGSSTDIQELRSARDSLADSEKRLLAIIDGSTNLISLKDPDGRYLLVNREFETSIGISRDQVIGKKEEDLFELREAAALHTDDRAVPRPDEVMASEELAPTETVPRWTVVQKFPIVDSDGRLYATAHITTGVSERTRAEEELRRAEDRARLVLDSSLDAVITIDAGGAIIGWSRRAEDIFGWSCREAVGMGIADTIIPVQYRDDHLRGVRHFLATGEGPIIDRRIEITALHRDGREFPVELTVAAIRSEPTWHFTAFVRDLTEQRRVEEALRETRDELTRVTRLTAMGHLTASIAHEINQPIGAAIAYANAALNWLDPERANLEEARRAIGRVVEAGVRAGDVIDRIRALVKKAPTRKDRVDINDAVLGIVELTRGEMAKNAISIQMQLAERVPAVWGDRVQLQQVILNLLINAIEAMSASEGSRILQISTGASEPDGVLVAVRDSGPGLAPDSADRLFDPFYTTKTGGLGMGLSISRSIVEAHRGQLWAGANFPRGTVFHFTLPADADAGQSDH